MRSDAPRPVKSQDYAPYPFDVEDVSLTFRLDPQATRVISRITFTRTGEGPLRLDGEAMRLVHAAIDGEAVEPRVTPGGLTIEAPGGTFTWECEVEIAPAENTALEGLYMSNGMYCTQCEAEGFRKITYYPDRPDVMAPFEVRIESGLPILLSNGDPVETGDGHAVWRDPWKKPAYLFALVAGDLVAHRDIFTTMEGRHVDLAIWVRPGDEDRCAYAMDSLIRSMKWDENHYGRAYDLGVFNIVAVDDFNMGAMENKGLNIFNARYVLASPETATDADYARIEAIIAHEYFHNWTGNRITCRDWFQLCLKEGLTVFRDQQFSGDERGHGVKRIEDVQMLRTRQFREDTGPLAHPVRPMEYVEINNFYTATVYEKGAEIIGMLHRLVGAEGYRAGTDLYFERHDGEACTIEDWLKVFEDATGRDLSQFALWYAQAGTPRVTAKTRIDGGKLQVDMTQSIPDTPGQRNKAPMVLPIALGAIGRDGREVLPTTVVELTEATQTTTFDLGTDDAAVSLNRGFSAPIVLTHEAPRADRLLLLAHDTDPYVKWESGRILAKEALLSAIDGAAPDTDYLDALAPVIADDGQRPAFRAMILGLPSEDDVAQTLAEGGRTPDPAAIEAARDALLTAMGERLGGPLTTAYETMATTGPYSPDAEDAGRRSLRNAALARLTRTDPDLAKSQFAGADNMTDSLAALSALIQIGAAEDALAAFEDRWRDDRLVMDKWFSLQIAQAPGESALTTARRLAEHPAFDWTNPNRFRSVLGALGTNHAAFHNASGDGYRFVADWIARLDPKNPQTAARMTTMFETWRRYDADRQGMVEEALGRIRAQDGLSADVTEMVDRILGA